MHPYLRDAISMYFLMWTVAAVTCIGGGTIAASRAGFPIGRSVLALMLLALSLLVGSKLLYLAEAWRFPNDSYMPPELRDGIGGFRLPGGILALAVCTPLVCRVAGLPWRRFGDALIPLAAVAVAFIRLGCFFNGCCFGKVSALPWAMTFPPGSDAFWYHQRQGWISGSAPASLPVHPLQLYFVLVALMIGLVLVRHQGRHPPPGTTQLLFYLLFFASTALLEPFRARVLTLNNWLAVAGALATAVVWLVFALVDERQPALYRGAWMQKGNGS